MLFSWSSELGPVPRTREQLRAMVRSMRNAAEPVIVTSRFEGPDLVINTFEYMLPRAQSVDGGRAAPPLNGCGRAFLRRGGGLRLDGRSATHPDSGTPCSRAARRPSSRRRGPMESVPGGRGCRIFEVLMAAGREGGGAAAALAAGSQHRRAMALVGESTPPSAPPRGSGSTSSFGATRMRRRAGRRAWW